MNHRLRDSIRQGTTRQLREQAEAERQPVPEGTYPLELRDGTLIETDDDDAIELDWVVPSGPHQGRHIFQKLILSGRSLPFAIAHLDKLNIPVESLDSRTLPRDLTSANTYGNRYKVPIPSGVVIEASVGQWTGKDNVVRNQINSLGKIITPALNVAGFTPNQKNDQPGEIPDGGDEIPF